MTPQELLQAIEKLAQANGFDLRLAIVHAPNQLDVTEALAQQWQYVPVVRLVKRPEPQPETPQPGNG